MNSGKQKHTFPWRPGNRCSVLVDGRRFYPVMLESIGAAREHILVEMYLVQSGRVAERFIEALTHAASRNVRVFVLLDAYGSAGLSKNDRMRLTEAGAHLAFYNPIRYASFYRNLYRDHRKLLLIDGAMAFVGGAGITDEFDPPDGGLGWRETMLQVEGPCVDDWRALFVRTWNAWSAEPLSLESRAKSTEPGQWGRVVIAEARDVQHIVRELLKRVRRAHQRVWIATAYFVPSWKVKRALGRAARRGVDVRVLLPGPYSDHPAVRHAGQRFYGGLLRHGVRVFEYQPRFTHSKFAICDDWVTIGSSNIDRWNLTWNLEANQEVADERLVSQVAEVFAHDLSQSAEITYDAWLKRPLRQRMLEWFWGRVDLWLDGFARARRVRPPKGDED